MKNCWNSRLSSSRDPTPAKFDRTVVLTMTLTNERPAASEASRLPLGASSTDSDPAAAGCLARARCPASAPSSPSASAGRLGERETFALVAVDRELDPHLGPRAADVGTGHPAGPPLHCRNHPCFHQSACLHFHPRTPASLQRLGPEAAIPRRAARIVATSPARTRSLVTGSTASRMAR